MDRFLDHWKNVELQNRRLRRALYGTLVVALVEAWGLGRLAVVPPPIYVVPGTAAVGRYQPDTKWHEVVQQFAEGYMFTLANFTTETAPKSYHASLRYLAPQALSVARSQLTGELDRMTLAAIPRSTGNPYGLQILAVKQEDTTHPNRYLLEGYPELQRFED